MASRKRNLLSSHKADVAYTRAGLTISVEGVQADDAALVAQAILNTFRQLHTAGYDELSEHTFTAHAGGYDVAEDSDIDTVVLPPEARRPVGFR